jgi:hypothetical protein
MAGIGFLVKGTRGRRESTLDEILGQAMSDGLFLHTGSTRTTQEHAVKIPDYAQDGNN